MSSGISFETNGLQHGLNAFGMKADIAFQMYASTSAMKLQGSAQENRRWTDRSGAARQRLRGEYYPYNSGYRIRLSHGVWYGLWLELAREKKYAIIENTIRFVGTFEIMPGFEKLLEKLSL